MIIRTAIVKDLPALVEIYNQAISAQKTAHTQALSFQDRLEWFESHAPDKYPLLVAELDQNVVGYLTVGAYRTGRQALRHTAEVSFYLHQDYQRKGLASKLMHALLEQAEGLGIKSLFAILLEDNLESIHFLKKHGFAQWGYLPGVADFDGREVGQYYFGLSVNNH